MIESPKLRDRWRDFGTMGWVDALTLRCLTVNEKMAN